MLRERRWDRIVGLLLVVYGALGIAVNLRLLPLLAEGVAGWAGKRDVSQSPMALAWLTLLQDHYDRLPWLPWAAWLLGAGLLAIFARAPGSGEPLSGAEPQLQSPPPASRWLFLLPLFSLLLFAGYIRMSVLWPQSTGISQLPYDDEGVYAAASQLFLQGTLPYRDYFFAHPPMAALSYAPAMAYHFNEWGSPTSFIIARYLAVLYSLLTLALIFGIGTKLAGVWGGTIAGLLWALDGRVVEINRKVMLDGPMVLFSCAALFLYLLARPSLLPGSVPTSRRPFFMLLAVGACGLLSSLTKIAGVACLVAILADMVWIRLAEKTRVSSGENAGGLAFGAQVAALLGGSTLAALLVVGPFIIIAPSQIARQIFFFQVLRPSDGLEDVAARISNITATLGNALTPLFAALGFLLISAWVWRGREASPWRVVALWTFLSVLIFTYSRSFYGHYYIQLAAPLCLLGAGVSLLPKLLSQRTGTTERRVEMVIARAAPLLLLAVVALPLVWLQWGGATRRSENRMFEVVARYVTDAIPPGTSALTTDVQFNFLAGRPPSRNDTGYLVDPYGHMISVSLGLGTRAWDDLLSSALRGEHSNDAYAVIQSPPAQADWLDRVSRVPLIVVQRKGYSWLTPETVSAIEDLSTISEQQTAYTIYRVKQTLR